jgi:hypothetical protein
LFIVPDAAERQAGLFRELRAQGHECGMHFHSQSWQDNYLSPEAHDYLGGYGPDEQYDLLAQARQQFADAVGFEPLSFRPGNCSANDHTFRVLTSLGFRCGSVSQPGRCVVRLKAVWTAACRAVHRAHAAFRLVPGSLDFVEVPLTVDMSRTDDTFGVGDIRFETSTTPDVRQGIQDSLNWLLQSEALCTHLCFLTHNFVSYSKPSDDPESRLPVLEGALRAIAELAARYGLEPEGVTISAMRERYLAAEKEAERSWGASGIGNGTGSGD